MTEQQLLSGEIELIYERMGIRRVETWRNTILTAGKVGIAKGLAGDIGSSFGFYVCKMQFGTNGQDGSGNPIPVNPDRNTLFGPAVATKNVSAIIDPNARARVIFTAVLLPSDAVGATINEMALQMFSGDLYSMATRGGVYKDAQTSLTFNWRVNIL